MEDHIFSSLPLFLSVEIDYYWDALANGGDPAAQMCGWLKDRFGVSWQIVPRERNEMIRHSDTERRDRITNAYLQMKKFDLEELRRVYRIAMQG